MGLAALPIDGLAPDAAADGLILAHGRTFAHFHSFYDHARALPTLAGREEFPILWIAPKDAKAREILDGAPIELSNERGSFAARAMVTSRIPAGTVWIRAGWPGLNVLIDATSVLPLTALNTFPFPVGQSNFGARVEVCPLRDKKSFA